LTVAATCCLLLLLPYLEVAAEGRTLVSSVDDVSRLGVDFTRVRAGAVLWGDVLGRERFELAAFPGVTLLTLAASGLIRSVRNDEPTTRRLAVAGLAFVLLGAFLALGTAGSGWRSWSPYRLLFEYAPGVRILRAAARAWVLGLLGLGLIAGLGCRIARPSSAAPRNRLVGVLAAVGVMGIVVEGYEPWADKPTVEVSGADRALAANPAPGGVLYLPMFLDGPDAARTTFGQARNVYGRTAHHRRTPNGYSGIQPQEWLELSERMERLPDDEAVEELLDLGVRFVVVRADVLGTPWESLLGGRDVGPLQLIGEHEGDLLYALA
jgi:hypothetical protein